MASTPIRRVQNATTDMTSPPIAVTVGKGISKKTFYLHRALLVSQSEYFEAACKSEWKEGSSCIIDLPDDNPAAFEIFTQFAYHGYISTASSEATMSRVQRKDGTEVVAAVGKEIASHRDCWLLGDKLLATNFKDAIIDSLIDFMKTTNWYCVSTYRTTYPRTAGPCGLRRLLVDVAVYQWQESEFKNQVVMSEWMEFFKDVAIRQKEVGEVKKGSPPSYFNVSCDYHDHGDKPCYRTLTW